MFITITTKTNSKKSRLPCFRTKLPNVNLEIVLCLSKKPVFYQNL